MAKTAKGKGKEMKEWLEPDLEIEVFSMEEVMTESNLGLGDNDTPWEE